MAISKKGARKIIVNDVEYLYKVSKIKKKSDWRAQENELNDTFMKYASYYGLGEVRDITINVVIQLMEKPVSDMYIKFNTIILSGFMGPEQITQITPKMIVGLINYGLKNGWKPSEKGDYRLNLVETTKDKQPVILQLPNMNEDVGDYQNLERPIEIKINHQDND